jgi:hypothetical protein
LDIYTDVPPVPERQLDRLPTWSRDQANVSSVSTSTASFDPPDKRPPRASPEPPRHIRMAQHLDRITNHAESAPTLGR